MKKKSSQPPARNKNSLRPFSSVLVDGPDRAPARAMLYPVGFRAEDFFKPIIGIASTWSNATPCNMHMARLALEAEAGANELPLRLDQGESDATLAHRMGEGLGVRASGEVSNSLVLSGCVG